MATRKRKSTQKSTPRKAPSHAKKTGGNGQVAAIVLFAVAILLLCVALIPSDGALWTGMKSLVFGLFGWLAYLVPIALGAIAVFLAREKSMNKPMVLTVAITLMIATLMFVIEYNADKTSFMADWMAAFGHSFKHPSTGGLIGALFGYLFFVLLGKTGAIIVAVLLLFATVMLVTGTTLMRFIHLVSKPVKKAGEGIQHVVEEAGEKMRSKDAEADETEEKPEGKRRSRIDIEMGDGYVDQQTPAEAAMEELRKTAIAEPKELPQEKGNKRAALEKAARDLHEEPETDKPQKGAEMPEDLPDEVVAEAPAVYKLPPLTLLDHARSVDDSAASLEMKTNAELLVKTLRDFGVETQVSNIVRGPAVTRYELGLAAGVKISKITGLSDDIAMRLATTGVRIEAPIPGKAAVGIEIPNRVKSSVSLRELVDSAEFRDAKSKLTVALGKDITGQSVMVDLSKMPHLLIAGTTGSGKSVCTNSMIQSILFRARPDEVKLLLIDPKQVEFTVYNGIPHLIVPVVTDPRKAAGALGWAVTEMLRRYQTFASSKVRDIKAYNEKAETDDSLPKMPHILIVIDELADLMMAAGNEVEDSICRLAQMARAAGMHMVIATQRPSTDVITGLIKSNIPSRLSLTVASAVDSRIILDGSGAEKLLGNGDMLFMPIGLSKPVRVQGCFVSDREVNSVVQFLKPGEEDVPEYDQAVIQEIERQAAQVSVGGKGGRDVGGSEESDGDSFEEADPMLAQAVEVVLDAGEASTSLLQRKLRLGYARAGRLIDDMEQRGIIGPHVGSKPRELMITRAQWMEMNMMSDNPLGDDE
ncbi:MAG: DNA translocase FtsK [Clostridia bacterium]|nr:DNA translocase FtsK [Clostridia bacterium]